MWFSFILASLALAFSAEVETGKLQIVGISSEKIDAQNYWFRLEKWNLPNHLEVRFLDAKMNLLLREKVFLDPEKRFSRYEFDQIQTGETAEIRLEPNQVKFIFRDKERTREKTRSLDPEDAKVFLVPPMLSDFLPQHWEEAIKAGQLDVKIAIPDRLDFYSFRFTLLPRQPGQDFHWEFEARNFFVGLVAGKIIFVYDVDKKLKAIRGIRPPVKFKTKDGVLEDRRTNIELL